MPHLSHRRWVHDRVQNSRSKKLCYEHFSKFTFFHSLPVIFFLLIFSKNNLCIAEEIRGYLIPFSSSINLLILFVIMSENTFMQMESPLFRDQSGVPAERLYKTVTPFFLQQTVVRLFLCNQISGLCFIGENSHWRLAAYNRFYGCCFRWEAS